MANLLWWQAVHALCILAHVGMFVFGAITFIFNDFGFDTPRSAVKVPWAASAVGAFGTQVNGVLFYLLQRGRVPLDRGLLRQSPVRLDTRPLHPSTPEGDHPYPSTETPETVYYQTMVVIFIGAMFNAFFAGADWALASSGIAVESKYRSGLLTFVSVIAGFAGAAALATIVADVVKVMKDRAHQRDIERRDLDEIDTEYRDEEEE